jgi:copper chaperone CopZ
MKKVSLKTNIMCGSCIAKVTPVFNESFGEHNWKVDIQSPDKVLTVNAENITEAEVEKAVEKAGYKAVKS